MQSMISFRPNVAPKDFWEESNALARNRADPILVLELLDKTRLSGKVRISKSAFREYGKTVKLFRGIAGSTISMIT